MLTKTELIYIAHFGIFREPLFFKIRLVIDKIFDLKKTLVVFCYNKRSC